MSAPSPYEQEPTPNGRQQELISSLTGTYLVDAGAGTGKTFAITRRYANILDSSEVAPDDILLITFTRNAATEMKDRIVRHCDYSATELSDAPIQTFHSVCHDILQEYGFDAPTHLGIDDHIPNSVRIIEDDIVESALFREFFEQFTDDHPEYEGILRTISDPSELLELIGQLASKGVFPTAGGWYRDGESHLEGDFATFKQQFDELNAPRNGGSKQSRLRSKLNRYGRDKCYAPDAPQKSDIRGDGKQVPEAVATRIFHEDREHLKSFVHDIYFEYIEFALSRNYLNFGFLQLFAFVLLCENHALRENLSYEYVMVDEFQDSSEIQFKLSLLLSATDNICVVGDWKQSIYSFQYADVENILQFDNRLSEFAGDLNTDYPRIQYNTSDVQTIELKENYRSTQSILDFSEESLVTPAANHDSVEEAAVTDRIVSLKSNSDYDNTQIEALQHEEEHEAILTAIDEIVGNDAYSVEDEEGALRVPEYRDITVLTRTRDFGRELREVAAEYGLPMSYEGGIELFRTDEAKLLLAWLRILESDSDRGWAPVLEYAGYTLDEIDYLLETEDTPVHLERFQESLHSLESLSAVIRRVFDQYGFSGPHTDVLLHTIESIRETTTLTRGDLIRFIARGIEQGSTHEVNTSAGTDSVTVQTIHATKGLEHPIVILANMNAGRFPPSGGSSATISYNDAVGLRQRKVYGTDHGRPHIYDNWRVDVLNRCRGRNYDEERRLLYVAITRAESHVLFTAGDSPNEFIQRLPVEVGPADVTVPMFESAEDAYSTLHVPRPTVAGPTSYSPHSLMDETVYEEGDGGKGKEFGTQVHDYAEQYVLGDDVAPSNDDEQHVKSLIDSLSGELRAEEDAYLPLETEAGSVTLVGVIDLLQIDDTCLKIIDYKTDRSRRAEPEYRKQLSVYYHVLDAVYPDRAIEPLLFYTESGTKVPIDPLSLGELRELVTEISG